MTASTAVVAIVAAAAFAPQAYEMYRQLRPRTPALTHMLRGHTPVLKSGVLTRLVFVHENERMRQAIGRLLQDRGFNCVGYASGLLALSEMAREPPALVIADAESVGEMDGLELSRRLKTDPLLCATPLVLLAARGLPSDRISGYRAGASAYVAAPFDPEELLAVVNAQLSHTHLTRAATLHNELQPIKADIASIKQMVQLLLQVQMQSLRGSDAGTGVVGDAAPKLLTQLEDLARLGPAAGPNASAAALVPLSSALAPPLKVPKLTKRERTVLDLVGEGRLNKEIALELGVSKSHIEKYVRRLLLKTETSNRTELVRRALQMGLLTDHPRVLQASPAPTAYQLAGVPLFQISPSGSSIPPSGPAAGGAAADATA
uniref:Uncharacterized protein n=1 Tax=Coccolithus braarudii TaxID=221442 RepID=A0A7S0LQ87_9EUKA|mmetsp:Transcript_50860/g.108623  ORF Transcript_50860/g.108623 Transcript_50860/m.108623 type:complete len:375 (+) Transcript_50860:32-1156(+)